MSALGDVNSATDILTKAVRSGTISVIITDLTKAITFATAMPSANYRVFLQVESSLATVLWAASKTTAGFSLNLSVGVAGSISWLVIEDS